MKSPIFGALEIERFAYAYGNLRMILVSEDDVLEVLLPIEEIEKTSKIGIEQAKDSTHRKQEFEQIRKQLKQVRGVFAKVDYLDLSSLSPQELQKTYQEYSKTYSEILKLFSRTEFYFFDGIEKEIQKAVFVHLRDKGTALKLLSLLLTSRKANNIITKEELARINLALDIKKDPKITAKRIKKHLEDYSFIPYAEGLPSWTVVTFQKKLDTQLTKTVKELEKTRNQILSADIQLIKKQQEIEKKLNLSHETLSFIQAVKDWQEIKWEMRVVMGRIFYLHIRFYEVIASRTFLSLNQIANLLENEMRDKLDGKTLDLKTVNMRLQPTIGFIENNKLDLKVGKDAQKNIEKVRLQTAGYKTKVSKIMGNIANPGHAKGVARTFSEMGGSQSLDEKMERMKQGEILIAGTTGPEFMPAIRKAAAIVTDEGGVNSHAAIVARELNIPCLVGAEFALHMIHDGDMVEVDANQGFVKII